MIVYRCCLLLLAFILCASSESAEDLQSRISAGIRSYSANLDRQIRALDHLLETYYRDWNYTEEDAHEYVSNPINTYMLIKRTGLEWGNVKKVLFNETAEAEAEQVKKWIKIARGEELPDEEGHDDEAKKQENEVTDSDAAAATAKP